ncbi:MAG: TOMM precursor leader peptide-binding protein, partial [Pseudomonadota bacterium]
MIDLAATHNDATPLERGLAMIQQRRAAVGHSVELHVYHGDDPVAQDVPIPAETGSTLLIGIASDRLRVGPVLSRTNGGCVGCLSHWIAHNRPDASRWRQIAQLKGSPDLGTYPWTPAAVDALLVTVEAAIDAADPQTFHDIEIDSLAVTPHSFLRYPGCTHCDEIPLDGPDFVMRPSGAVQKQGASVFRTQKLASVAALRDSYVDHRVGLVRHMYRDFTSKMLPMWGAETKLTASEEVEIGFGRAESGQTAEAVAILESLERFCGLLPRNRAASVRGSYSGLSEAGEPVVDPRDFLLSEENQHSEPGYRLPPYSPDLECDWLWAYSFKHDGPVLVPQQFCFYSGGLTPRDERYVIETSNGCALGGAYEEAIFHGLLELIERDAYMTRWHVKGSPQRIELNDPAMPQVARLHARATAEGFE